ncbi:imidazole glycerol phosphate synthase subunit HisH [Idiomarina xiamenensis]|uniref:Imidazole glycerol phosphate synthase subunit HisH n=1 Tax=Idiomarina xiamenensis 10-D-4 TaxID=740709 RepID=K2K5H2_9GAMM|nr:imidazole glycerol phosphate synthase subunit HisH [Idiomarina xiamenensis]EKE82833.1 glutamine amidotransferase [Idiomarina xiamenensis 10-D-4]
MNERALPVVIINTECANLASVANAVKRLGYPALVSDDAGHIERAERVILPGVGSAAAAMRSLQQKQLVHVIQQLQQPLLGICLGMQLLTDYSSEGDVRCLGVIPGQTERLQVAQQQEQTLPLPHMGWNTLQQCHPAQTALRDNDYYYFVHSYAVAVNDYTLASCHYGQTFAAVIGHNNFYGTQFHPERSGAAGARLLQQFLENGQC